jgi:hypothetical protein
MGAIKPPSSSLLGLSKAFIQRLLPPASLTKANEGQREPQSVHDYAERRPERKKYSIEAGGTV